MVGWFMLLPTGSCVGGSAAAPDQALGTGSRWGSVCIPSPAACASNGVGLPAAERYGYSIGNMPQPALDVLYEDNHLLVINKPAGLATQGALPGTASVVTLAQDYLKRKYQKPGNVYVGVVSRLDAPVSGVLVLARTSKAAARLTRQFQTGAVEKTYWAIVELPPEPSAGEWEHWLLKNDARRRVEVVPANTPGAQRARLRFHTLRRARLGTLLEIQLLTGRKHQIRVQLAAIGSPVVGDRKYGSTTAFSADAIALHCVRLALEHPTLKTPLEFRAPPPAAWGSVEG
jgi:23S rRNA pseudouridine1911/1915/1917 synthase